MNELEQALAALLLVVEDIATPDNPTVGLARQAEVLAAWKTANHTVAAKAAFKPLTTLFTTDPLVLQTSASPAQLVLQHALSAGGDLAIIAEAVRRDFGLEVWRVAQEVPLRLGGDTLIWSPTRKTVGVVGHGGYAFFRTADFVEREGSKSTASKVAFAIVDDTRFRALVSDSFAEGTIGEKKLKTLAAAPVAANTTAFVDADGAAWIESAVGGAHELVTLRAGAKEPTRTPIAGVAHRVCTIAGLHHVTGTVEGKAFHVGVDEAGVITRQPPVDAPIDAVFAIDGEAHVLLRVTGEGRVVGRLQDLDGNVVVDDMTAPTHQLDVQRAQGALWSGVGERVVNDVHSFPIVFDDPKRGPLGLVVTDDAVICLETVPGAADKTVLRRYVRAS